MVESTLRVVDPSLPFAAVHASRGKIARAEPVAALYEQGRVHHQGVFGQLEDQMCSLARGGRLDGDRLRQRFSPDRVDALVWAITDLLLVPMVGEGIYEIYRELSAGLSQPGRPKS
jgi:phage terminase large subunit-like protein